MEEVSGNQPYIDGWLHLQRMVHVRGSESRCFRCLLFGGHTEFCRTSCNSDLGFYFLRHRTLSLRTQVQVRSQGALSVCIICSCNLCLQPYLSPNCCIPPRLGGGMPLWTPDFMAWRSHNCPLVMGGHLGLLGDLVVQGQCSLPSGIW